MGEDITSLFILVRLIIDLTSPGHESQRQEAISNLKRQLKLDIIVGILGGTDDSTNLGLLPRLVLPILFCTKILMFIVTSTLVNKNFKAGVTMISQIFNDFHLDFYLVICTSLVILDFVQFNSG